MIKEIRELTGLSHQKLGAWLGVSKSMVQFAEFSFRTLQGAASNKIIMMALAIQRMKDEAKEARPEFTGYTAPANFAAQHKEKMDHHSYQAEKMQRQLKKLMKQHARILNGLALLDIMKTVDTPLYTSTEKDVYIASLLDSFDRDKIEPLCKKMELLHDGMNTHLAYAEIHKQSLQRFEGMGQAGFIDVK